MKARTAPFRQRCWLPYVSNPESRIPTPHLPSIRESDSAKLCLSNFLLLMGKVLQLGSDRIESGARYTALLQERVGYVDMYADYILLRVPFV